MEARSLVFFVASDDPVRLTHLATMVMSGVLLDRPVVVVWMGAALGHLMAGAWIAAVGCRGVDGGAVDETAPRRPAARGRLLGSVAYLACSADARRLGLDRRRSWPGWTTCWR
jgi:hypothetical protein